MEPEYLPGVFEDCIEKLMKEVMWGQFTTARQECFMAEVPTYYTYGSGRGVRTYTAVPFYGDVKKIQDDLNASGSTYNVCFLNRYDDAGQHLGWHADDSPGMDMDHPIAVVSFGQAREIWWRPNGQTGPIPEDQRRLLEPGSVFIMPAGFQRLYQHRIPKGDRTMKPRVSLTYRHYVP